MIEQVNELYHQHHMNLKHTNKVMLISANLQTQILNL